MATVQPWTAADAITQDKLWDAKNDLDFIVNRYRERVRKPSHRLHTHCRSIRDLAITVRADLKELVRLTSREVLEPKEKECLTRTL